jgi:spore coat polysaccharide biosynthesis protein SpsF (cytidylyltransferase family)
MEVLVAKIGVILQARLASARFPRKIVAKFGQWTVIEQAMGALNALPAEARIIATDLGSLAELTPIAKRFGWEIFAGHATDVMKRMIDCAKAHDLAVIVRATADNPLVDLKLATWQLGVHLKTAGAATRVHGATPGTAVEVVNLEALEAVWPKATPQEREHVMPGVYRRLPYTKLIVKRRYAQPVTIDTEADLARVEDIYEHGMSGASIVRKD